MQRLKKLMHLALLLVLCVSVLAGCGRKQEEAPNGVFVQMGNPLVEVASVQEMEDRLGYQVPVLDKEVQTYIVLVIDGVADSGRIHYTDGTVFHIKKGSGDISGIYGGTEEKTETLGGVSVTFLTFEGTRYAIWEQGGFAYSLTGGQALEADVAALIG
jgi:hypothetical protein